MGSFLTTSLLTKFSTSKSNLDLLDADNDQQKKLQLQKLFLDTDIDMFNISETDDALIYELKEDLLQDELVDFLATFYKDLYGNNTECKEILERLNRDVNAAKWLEIAEEQEFYKFQLSEYGHTRIYHGADRISINYDSIILASEGKISMETYGLHFAFFESLIRKVYSNYKLAHLIKIGFSG